MNKQEAVSELRKHDHAFLTQEGAERIAEPFGFKPVMSKHYDTRSQFKGLTLWGKNPITGKEFKEGDYAMGIEAHKLAMQLCKHVGVEYQDMFGIGSQLRACCDALTDYCHAK
ncbi:MAG: hypothetical protein [Siphoviridae sp. cttb18]|nr:MAG: hypothetical protein [Siphoviridae sp. cttb18]